MTKFKVLVLLFASISSCTSTSQQTCLSSSNDLHQLEIDFEVQLKKYYKIESQLESKDYRKFIVGIVNENIQRELFTDAKSLDQLELLKRSPTFKLIWNHLSLIKDQANHRSKIIEIAPPRTFSDEPSVERIDLYVIDPNSDIFNCLIDNTTNSELKAILEEIQKTPELSPEIIAQRLIDIDDFDDSVVRTYICLQFYYNFMLMINNLNVAE